MRLRIKPKRGGDKTLDAWRQKLKTAGELLETISRNQAEEMAGLTRERFRKETNPYGQRWFPKQKPDGRKTLSGKTSRLKNGWHVKQANKRGFIVAPSVDYATFHQSGTRRMPQRMMIPDASRGLPPEYSAALKETAQEIIAAHFKNVGRGDSMSVSAGRLPSIGGPSAKAVFVKVMRAAGVG